MAGKIVNHRNLNVEDVSITVPEKIKGKYTSYISSNKKELYVQTPRLVFDKDGNGKDGEKGKSFLVKIDNTFDSKMNALDEHCIDVIYKNSENFFNKKKFSKEKITASYVKTLKPIDNKHSKLSVNINEKNVLIKDQYEVERNLNDIVPGTECILILHIDKIVYSATSMHLSYTVPQIKMYVQESLKEWSILQDDEDDIDNDVTDEDDDVIYDENNIIQEVAALYDDSHLNPKIDVLDDVQNDDNNVINDAIVNSENDENVLIPNINSEISLNTDDILSSEKVDEQKNIVKNDDDKTLF